MAIFSPRPLKGVKRKRRPQWQKSDEITKRFSGFAWLGLVRVRVRVRVRVGVRLRLRLRLRLRVRVKVRVRVRVR